MWNAENPHTLHERSLNSTEVKIMMQCLCMEKNWSHFIREILTAEHYQELILNFISMLQVDKRY